MDNTIQRIIQEVAKEQNLDVGFLLRVMQLEEEKAHLSRRHGLFDELRGMSRKAAQRELSKTEAAEHEN